MHLGTAPAYVSGVNANNITLSEASKALFTAYVKDSGNWSGMPCVGGNVGGSKQDAGNLTDLKRKKLLRTFEDEGLEWIVFTEVGTEYAKLLGLEAFIAW